LLVVVLERGGLVGTGGGPLPAALSATDSVDVATGVTTDGTTGVAALVEGGKDCTVVAEAAVAIGVAVVATGVAVVATGATGLEGGWVVAMPESEAAVEPPPDVPTGTACPSFVLGALLLIGFTSDAPGV
jgi:hypothetical protein